MLEIHAEPVPEAVNGDVNIPFALFSWLLRQENTDAEVLISIEQTQHNSGEMFFTMKEEFKLASEENVPV
ncbi:Protein CBG01964 [Caenorhabditis briggsae]|nr:Protein CBG01964 [Caenorhabditis briggsae]ULT80474.1 hypothetical protein L3Y34_010797 [Caenorhabditis briggsae]CAP23154.1 Protein CBG01964 [Caenorhabditis briggsae]